MIRLLPDKILGNIFEITPDMLKALGIRALALDIDNTLAPYSAPVPSERTLLWLDEMKREGIICFVISNNCALRAEKFCKSALIPFASHAKKPSKKALSDFARRFELAREEILVVGDQIFTDVWMATNYGSRVFMEEPIDPSLEIVFIRVKRVLEKPFIYAYKLKHRRKTEES